mmetsp:Transcript_11231/g.23439  ORF Transcript_11231/g.23439 Transcript_11231/m.23439 type:complete len:228 (-) Transcript_11231:584-1267(-)
MVLACSWCLGLGSRGTTSAASEYAAAASSEGANSSAQCASSERSNRYATSCLVKDACVTTPYAEAKACTVGRHRLNLSVRSRCRSMSTSLCPVKSGMSVASAKSAADGRLPDNSDILLATNRHATPSCCRRAFGACWSTRLRMEGRRPCRSSACLLVQNLCTSRSVLGWQRNLSCPALRTCARKRSARRTARCSVSVSMLNRFCSSIIQLTSCCRLATRSPAGSENT